MSEQKKPYQIEGRPRTIYRVVKSADNPYVMIDKRPIENNALSYKAKGILTYLMSRPDGWEVSIADLINRSTDGKASVRAGMRELKKAGHVKYTVTRDGRRITGLLIEVYEQPGKQEADFQPAEKQHAGNRTQVLNTLSINERERYGEIARKLAELQGGGLKGTDADYISVWMEKHENKWILKAITTASDNGARSARYVDRVLIGWEANGYPKTREELVRERKASRPHTTGRAESMADMIDRVLGEPTNG